MGYRFLDDYDPRKEQKKKQQQKGTQKAPPSGNPLNPAAQNNKNNKTNTPAATQPRTSKGTALGGSSVTPVQLPVQQITVPKLTKAATPMQTQTPQALTLKLPNIQAFGAGDYSKAGKAMDRIAKTVQAGAAQTASGFAEIAGQFRPTTGQQSMGQFSGFGDLGRAVRENREKGTDINTSILLQERQRRVQQKKSQQKIFDAATRLTERGQQYTQEAKQGLGTVGQFLVDMGVTGTQMAGDALANLILPGSGLVMMGMRSYGQAAGEARREGKSEGQQFLAGLKSAGIEVFTEKMFGAFSKIYGGAAADELVQKLVGKLTENATGQALLTWIVNAVGEGVEEVTSDLLNPLADRLLRLDDGKGPVWSTDDLAQWGYDFLLGTAMGMFGGGQQLVRGVQQGQAQTAENNYYADLRRNGLGSANRAANAQRASDAMGRIMPTRDGLRMPRLVDEQGRTYEERTTWQQIPEARRAEFDEAQRIARRFGARVVVSQQEGVNGSYHDGVISLNPNAANPVRQTLIHELTHHMESSGRYSEFRETALRYVAKNMGADVDSVRQALMADYAQNGVTLDEDGATREIVAKFAEEKLFTDEATVRRLLAEDRNLFQRIYDWIRDMAGKLAGTSEESFLRDAERIYAKALRETRVETGRGTQMLFAGKNARTANMQTLNRARALEASGVKAEDILRETGWFRGMDGKWRFEIDDSAMRYDRQGVTQNPDVQRKRQLEEKLLYGQLTQEETNELRALTEATRGIPGPRTLGDYIQHGALFEAYPELRDAAVVFEETEPGVNGYYNAGQNTIVLDSKLRGAPESTLVHEIQHAVQRAEGFARGSTPEYWKYKNKNGQAYRTDRQYMEAEKRGRDAFDAMPDSVQDEVRRINRAKSDQDWDEVLRLEDDIYNGPYAELYSAYDLAEFDRRSRVDYYKGANYVDLYTNTAGEIEARDAANRRSYSAEQRRLRMPNLGNANTVFAGGNMGYFAMSAEEQAGIREQLRRNSDRLNAMDVVGRVNTSAYVGLDTGIARTKLVEELGRRGYTVNRPGLGEVQFSEKEINNSLNYKEKNPAAEDARRTGFLVLRDVLKRGIEIDGHDGHKGRNYDTVTIAAPVEINGKRGNMAVVVKKTKGNRYKVHRILTPAGETFILPEMANAEVNTVGAVTNNSQLLRGSAPAINSAFEFSIPNNGGNVNTEQYSTGRGLDDLAGSSDYLDALARDENMFTSDAYTLADRLYDLQLRRAQQQEAPPERPAEQVAQEDLDEIAELFTDQGSVFASREDRIRDTENMVSDHTIAVEKSGREKASEAWSYFYRKMVDAGHSVSKFAQAVNDPYLYQIYNQARASSSAGVSMITDAQTNVNAQKVGESLNGIFSPIRAKGEDYYRAFQMYLFDLHNIDRMSLSKNKEAAVLEATAALNEFDADHPELRTNTEAQLARMTESLDPDVAELARERMQLLRNINKADAIKDKPVFSFDVTADVSQERARRALQEHPEFEQYRQQVRGYIDNLMQYRVDSGLMTQADVDYLKRLYPNYVPTMRKGENQAGVGRDRNAVRIGRTVGRAEGGTADLMPLHEALGRQTMKVVREGSKNRFGQRLLDDFLQAGENSKAARYVQEANEYEHDFAADTLDDMSREQLTKDKTLTVFKDGKLWELTVDDTMFDALKALSPDAAESNTVTRAVRTANNLFKALVTGYNPTFTIRNTVRDLQTAGLYTRDGVAFARNYPKALAEIKNNGQYWQMYKALGGSFSSVFDYNTGTVKEPKGRTAKLMAKIEALNMAMEQAPRLAEFMGVVEKGGTSTENLADALYAAADVTVNFGRAGTLGKVLNANYVPFLNPGIQGFDKMIRRVTETKGGKEWAKLIVRAAALGVAPALLNSLLYHDDEEWDELRDSDKDTNYMFKLGNGTWLKIPKGRELSLLGITVDRIGDAIQGKDVDLIATINTMGNQVAPANPLTSNIASALFEAQLFDPSSPGRTWYGGDIENQRLQSYAPGQRYDSSTDIFSKAVGDALGISPKKLNYVLDQYSGVVGDFLLPLLTPQAERGMFSKAFTVDVVTSNRLSGDFYDEADALTYAKNDGDETAAVVSRFWSKQQSACSDLYKQIRKVESSDLSDREKRQKTRELKALVNGIQKNAMASEETYRAAVEKNLQKGMDSDDAYRAANKDCFGAEYALQVYNKDVYEKAKNAKSNGVSYDDYYTYYFGTRGFEKTDDTSVTTQKFDWLQNSGMDLTSQAEIYFADMASDKVLETQAELEMSSGITAVQFYQYKVASSGMTKKAEKMQAINSLDLTSAQKDAIYYAEGWAQSTIRDAPWRGGDGGNYSRESSSSSRYLSYLAEKNGYTLQEAAPSAPRYSGYLQYLAARDGIPLDTEDTGSGLQSKYLREFASRWGG